MKKSSILAAVALLATSLQGQNTPSNGKLAPTNQLTIWFDQPNSLQGRAHWYNSHEDPSWENSSLPIGNGSLGGSIMGSVAAERITLNEKTLWRGGPNTAGGAAYYWDVNKESAHQLPAIRHAFTQGDWQEAARLTQEHFTGKADYEERKESPFRFGSFTTMGELYIETGLSEIGMSHYKRALSLEEAIATVSFQKEGVNYERTYFTSFPDSVMVIRFGADKGGKQNLCLSYGANPEATGQVVSDSPTSLLYHGKLKSNQMEFAIRIQATHQGGTLRSEGGKIWATAADEVTFTLTADTDYFPNFTPDFTNPTTYVGVNPLTSTATMMQQVAKQSYEELRARHVADYRALFDRVKLTLNGGMQNKIVAVPAPDWNNMSSTNSPSMQIVTQEPSNFAPQLPTYQRLKRYREGKPDYQLEELYYQFGRYLLIASSRPGNLPANLQGMWHNGVDGPWHVDYHNNINLQMNYWPACMTNLDECVLPLVDFIRTLVEPGKRTAQAYFGARGWTASISGNIFGFTAPLTDKDMSWNFNPMAGPWLATHIWEYYDYTRNLSFLKDTGYELIKEAANFTVDYLWKRPDGSYTAAPSTSPEHGPVDQGATFVHAVAREILLNAIEASKVLNLDKKERATWQAVLERLVPYQVGRYGQLMEWSTDIDDPNDKHRHVNQLFGLHPGQTISPITTPELAEASRIVLTHRGDGATGWSMGWKLNQWARLQDGNHAYKLYGNLLKNGTLDNLLDTHPPFQIDGNFGGTAGVTEMLLQSHMGFIQLLPALPDAWQEGVVEGLRARGNFEVAMEWKQGALTAATILSHSGGWCEVRYQQATFKFQTQKGKSYKLTLQNNLLQLVKS